MKQFHAKFILIHPHLLEEAVPDSIVRCLRPVCSFRSCKSGQKAWVEGLSRTKVTLRKPKPQAASEYTHGSSATSRCSVSFTGEEPEARKGRGLCAQSPGICLTHGSLDSDQPVQAAPSPGCPALCSLLS